MRCDAEQRQRPDRCLVQRFVVPFEYPICFTHNLFDPANVLFARTLRRATDTDRRLLVYLDAGLAAAQPDLAHKVRAYLNQHPGLAELVRPPAAIPGGERAKHGWSVVRRIMTTIGQTHLDRHSFVVAIGGGSMLDLVGFAASLVHRGIRLIRVPTTVLGQCDAGVGVKNGMDEHGQKNFVGTFAPPFAVLNDFDFLETLPAPYWIGGLAEAFKVAIIQDPRLFACLCRDADRLRARDGAAVAQVIQRTALLHLRHIRAGGDPFEMGAARPLDFGHWAAHRIEVRSRHRLGHGQAVSVGIALDVCYAATQGLLTVGQRDRILAALAAVGLPTWDDLLAETDRRGRYDILQGLEDFREHLGGKLTVTLPRGIGRRVEVHAIDVECMQTAIRFLQSRQASASSGCALRLTRDTAVVGDR